MRTGGRHWHHLESVAPYQRRCSLPQMYAQPLREVQLSIHHDSAVDVSFTLHASLSKDEGAFFKSDDCDLEAALFDASHFLTHRPTPPPEECYHTNHMHPPALSIPTATSSSASRSLAHITSRHTPLSPITLPKRSPRPFHPSSSSPSSSTPPPNQTYRFRNPLPRMPRRDRDGGRGGKSGGGRPPPSREVTISKALSFVLRHGAQAEGIELDEGGWANVADLVSDMLFSGSGHRRFEGVDVVRLLCSSYILYWGHKEHHPRHHHLFLKPITSST